MKNYLRPALAVASALFLTVGIGAVALASTGVVTISVNQTPVKFVYNGQDKTPPNGVFDNQGTKVPDAFIYDGTTYVPIRLVGEIIGQSVAWDGADHAVVLGQQATATALGAPYYCNTDMLCNAPTTVTMGGTAYKNAIQFTPDNGYNIYGTQSLTATYNLNSSYSTLTALVGLDSNMNYNTQPTVVTILGDGKQLWTYTFQPSDLPQPVSIPVAGVSKLTISIFENGNLSTAVDIANATLTP